MFRAKFIILFLLLTSCAGVPPEPDKLPPSKFKDRIEKIQVEPTIEIRKEKITKTKKAKAIKITKKVPYSVGEKLVYNVKYIGIPAGVVEVQVLRVAKVNGTLAYNFYATAKSSKLLSILYTVDDEFEAYVSVNKLQTLKHRMHMRESRRNQFRTMAFDHKRKKIIFYDRLIKPKKPPRIIEYEINWEHNAIDALGVLYWLRTQEPIVGKEYKRYVFDNGKFWLLKAKVLRKEEINTPLGKMKTFVVKPFTYHKGVLKQKVDSLIWVTDDELRIPVKIEARTKYGKVTVIIREMPQKNQ